MTTGTGPRDVTAGVMTDHFARRPLGRTGLRTTPLALAVMGINELRGELPVLTRVEIRYRLSIRPARGTPWIGPWHPTPRRQT